MSRFHRRDGWYFERWDDGTVRIEKYSGKAGTEARKLDEVAEIPAAEWASIIASVTSQGKTAESYATAQAFHAGVRLTEQAKREKEGK